ncbi:MAG: DUF1579 domain-containing protein [Planctomycetes bacterium]|nr:DUF1579 domain-containing protein [Planctomycetota bacterium]
MKRIALFAMVLLFALAGLTPEGASGNEKKKKKKETNLPAVERGPEHRVLESLVGAFDAKVKFFINPDKPMESTGTMTRKMILGGNYLQESFQGDFLGKKFEGLGAIGYDAVKKQFVNTWCDSMSTNILILHGTYDPDKKTFTQKGDDYDVNTKKKMKARDVLTIISADVQTLSMYRHPEGATEEFKVMDITFTRKKVDEKKKGKK